YVHLHDPREIQRLAEKEVEISEVTAKFTIGRDPQVHIEAIRDAFAAGLTEVYIHSGQADQPAVIDFYAREVLPKL
ncbi:MAG: hypothetical protein M3395_00115, partial [Chloroflexota bacterium]|nr:hypothetical protein [Chloroflexota bacterium]